MNVRIAGLAQREIDDAVAWYEAQASGLGVKFLDDFDRSVRRIAAYPMSCEEIEPPLRRCLLSRFPYGVIYGIDGKAIVVMARLHICIGNRAIGLTEARPGNEMPNEREGILTKKQSDEFSSNEEKRDSDRYCGFLIMQGMTIRC